MNNTKNIRSQNTHLSRTLDVVLGIFVVIFAILAVRYQYFLLKHIEWGDESETIVTAKMMASGLLLYSEIFNHHGPLTFASGLLLESFGDFGVRGHRVPVAILQMFGLIAIYCSPIFPTRGVKIGCTLFAAAITVFYLPDLFGHMYTYQAITGALLLIVLFLYTFPSLVDQTQLTPTRSFIGSLIISGFSFLAVTYAPLAGILFIVSLRRRQLKPAMAGLALGIAANVIFLAVFGSIKGYLAFHLYLNSEILPSYIGDSSLWQILLKALVTITSSISQYIFFAICAIGIYILASKEKNFAWRSILLALGIGSLLIRGADFHGLPYYYAVTSLLLLLTLHVHHVNQKAKVIVLAFVFICTAKASLLLPGDRLNFTLRRVPVETEFSTLAKKYTEKNDKIIVYSFQNYQYIAADRLPASGYFFYLPWQEEYNKNPKFDVKIDACKEISEYQPKIMLIDKWTVWGRFTWDSYAHCVQALLDEKYTQLPNRPYYIRNDIYAKNLLAH